MKKYTVIPWSMNVFIKIGGREREIHQFDSLASAPFKKVTDFRSDILKGKPRIYNSLFKQWKRRGEGREREREKEEWKSVAKRASAGVTIFSTASAERIRDWERQTRENRILSPITLRYNVCGQKCLDSIVSALFIRIYMHRDLKKKEDPFSSSPPPPAWCSSWLMNKGSANRIKGSTRSTP